MTFPVAVGTGPRHSSSRPFPTSPSPPGLESREQTGGRRRDVGHGVIMAVGTNDDGKLVATVFISYHFFPILAGSEDSSVSDGRESDVANCGSYSSGNEEAREYNLTQELPSREKNASQLNVIAELRVQITYAASPFVSSMDAMSTRETKSRVPLGVMRKRKNRSASYASASVEFSPNETHLACLVPLPTSYEMLQSGHDNISSKHKNEPTSTIVIFRIQTQNCSSHHHLLLLKRHCVPKFPDFVVEKTGDADRHIVEELDDNIHRRGRNNNFETDEISRHSLTSATSLPFSRSNSILYVAHEPKIVRLQHCADSAKENKASQNRSFLRKLSGGSTSRNSFPIQPPSLQCATCMCSVPSDHYRGKSLSAHSMLFVGTTNGEVLLVDFLTARVRSVVMEALIAGENDDEKCLKDEKHRMSPSFTSNVNGPHPVVHISQCAPTQWKPLDIYGEEQGSESKGRIAIIFRDGSVKMYTTFFLPINPQQNAVKDCVNVDCSSSNDTKKTRLEMKIEPLSTFHAAKLRSNASNLRYIRARWLNPLVLVLLIRSPFLDEDFLQSQAHGSSESSSILSSESVVAQVWTVAEVFGAIDSKRSNGWSDASDGVAANVSLVSELRIPCGDSFDELVHGTISVSQEDAFPKDGGCESGPHFPELSRMLFSECVRGMAIFHHQGTDTLAINSQVVTCMPDSSGVAPLKVRPFCLVWDWKRNVPGFTLATSTSYCIHPDHAGLADAHALPSLFSWFQLGEHESYGLCALYTYEHRLSGGRKRACKNIFSLGTLSPLNRFALEGSLSLSEPCALLLHCESVNFPFFSRSQEPTKNAQGVSLQWEESRIPATYVATNGPCQIAAVGKNYGRSIAVAASRGLCVLDLTRHRNTRYDSLSPRWKQFSNINDEQRFHVVSMVWWELLNEDLLLAIVQYKNIATLHLVCWSRKSLGFGEEQLLKDSLTFTSDGGGGGNNDGLVLPSGFQVQSMSIVRDPADGSISSAPSNRALILLAYVSCHEAVTSVNYTVLQLQAILSIYGKCDLVLAKKSACGKIPLQLGASPDYNTTASVTSTFLAGGSFVFDLERKEHDLDIDASKTIATIGVVTIFQGLIAVCVNRTGPILHRPLLKNSREGHCGVDKTGLIASYWVSGTISNEYGCRIAWNIVRNDGKAYCWSVLCRNHESSCQSWEDFACGGFDPALFSGLEIHSTLGEICYLGRSSLWMNGAKTSDREISMGPFCPVSFGCVLYAGQRSRKNFVLSHQGTMNSFHVSSCVVAPPQFTPFLFMSFLSLSLTAASQDFESKTVDVVLHRELAMAHIKTTLHQRKHHGPSSSALRVITLKVTELLNDSKAAGDAGRNGLNGDCLSIETKLRYKKWATSKAILIQVVSVVREIYDPLGFATFFLSVGRQLEPHQFNLIFPLQSGIVKNGSPQTAEDLFSISCEHGSLATALSALPLFSCHIESSNAVTKLVFHCLTKIKENFQSCSSHSALTSSEDEAFLHQLFWFGVKLEDSANSSALANGEVLSTEQHSDESASIFTLETSSSEEDNKMPESSFCQTPQKRPRAGMVESIVANILSSGDPPAKTLEENAIHEAASSFIQSGFDDLMETSCTSLELQDENNNAFEQKKDDDTLRDMVNFFPGDAFVPISVAGVVAIFICNVIQLAGPCGKTTTTPNYGWKAVSAVAYLLQGDRETIAITSAGSANAQYISCAMTTKDFFAAATIDNLSENIMEEEDSLEQIAVLLTLLADDCGRQIDAKAADFVFNLILLLLLRFDTCPDVQLYRATLISVGIVSGHMSGRIGELIDMSHVLCDINNIYNIYAAKLNV